MREVVVGRGGEEGKVFSIAVIGDGLLSPPAFLSSSWIVFKIYDMSLIMISSPQFEAGRADFAVCQQDDY
jgi:hypothetical protein